MEIGVIFNWKPDGNFGFVLLSGGTAFIHVSAIEFEYQSRYALKRYLDGSRIVVEEKVVTSKGLRILSAVPEDLWLKREEESKAGILNVVGNSNGNVVIRYGNSTMIRISRAGGAAVCPGYAALNRAAKKNLVIRSKSKGSGVEHREVWGLNPPISDGLEYLKRVAMRQRLAEEVEVQDKGFFTTQGMQWFDAYWGWVMGTWQKEMSPELVAKILEPTPSSEELAKIFILEDM